MLIRKFETRLQQISKNYGPNVQHSVMFECEFLELLKNEKEGVGKYYQGPKDKYFNYHLKCREAMRGIE